MISEMLLGVLLSLAAGAAAGNCMLPMKFARKWAWENTWLVFSVVSLVILPWSLALAAVDNLFSVYAAVPVRVYLSPLLFGFGWGVAQVLFGLSIARLGLALGYAIIIGLGALLGTLVPLFFQQRQVIGTPAGAMVLSGVAIMVGGIIVSSLAGRVREQAAAAGSQPSGAYGMALLIAVICGLLAPMINYSFAFGQGLAEEAVRQGASPVHAGYAVWPVGLTGGLIPNVLYSIYLLNQNGTWPLFQLHPRDLWAGTSMGALWMGAMAIYGVSSVYLGQLGTSVGWALFQIFMIMTANLSGMLTGEWRGAPRRGVRLLGLGLLLLALATVVISAGNSRVQGENISTEKVEVVTTIGNNLNRCWTNTALFQPMSTQTSRITDIEIRMCRGGAPSVEYYGMRTGGASEFEFLIVTMRTDEGVEGRSFGFAGRGASMAGAVAAEALKPFFLKRDPLAREKHW